MEQLKKQQIGELINRLIIKKEKIDNLYQQFNIAIAEYNAIAEQLYLLKKEEE